MDEFNKQVKSTIATLRTGPWVVWRQDDNGNRFEAGRFNDRRRAEELALEMESHGHKQIYWVADAGI